MAPWFGARSSRKFSSSFPASPPACPLRWSWHRTLPAALLGEASPTDFPRSDFPSAHDARADFRSSNLGSAAQGCTRHDWFSPSSASDSPISAGICRLRIPISSWRTILGIELVLVGDL